MAIITRGFSHDVNDWCLPALIELVRNLAARFEIDVYSLEYPHQRREYRVHGVRVLSFGMGRKSARFWPLKSSKAIAELASRHNQNSYDIVHAIWATSPARLARQLSERSGIPYIVTLFAGEIASVPEVQYGGFLSPRSKRKIMKNLMGASAITVGSAKLATLCLEQTGVDAQQIPLGIDMSKFRSSTENPGLAESTSILIAGSINRIKGHGVALRAIDQLANRNPRLMENIRLEICGEEFDNGAFVRSLQSMPIKTAFSLYGGRPFHEMPKVYHGADLTLVPSLFESQCMVALESAACGTPVVGADVGIIPQLASHNFVFEAGNPNSLANVLENILLAPSILRSEASRQQKLANTIANIERTTDSFASLYNELAKT